MYITLSGKSIKKELFSTARTWKTNLETLVKKGIEVVYNPLFQKFSDNKWLMSTAIYGRVFERINHSTSLKLYLLDQWSKLNNQECSLEYKNSITFSKELDYVVNYVFLNYYPYRNKKVNEPNKQLKYIEQRKEELQHWIKTAKSSWLIESVRKLAQRISKELGFSLETLYKEGYRQIWNKNYRAVKIEREEEYQHNLDSKSTPTVWEYQKKPIDTVKLIECKKGIQSKPVNPLYYFTSLRRTGKHLLLNQRLKKEVLAAFGLFDLNKNTPTEQAFKEGRARRFDYVVKSKEGFEFKIKVVKWLVEDLLDQEFKYPAGVLCK